MNLGSAGPDRASRSLPPHDGGQVSTPGGPPINCPWTQPRLLSLCRRAESTATRRDKAAAESGLLCPPPGESLRASWANVFTIKRRDRSIADQQPEWPCVISGGFHSLGAASPRLAAERQLPASRASPFSLSWFPGIRANESGLLLGATASQSSPSTGIGTMSLSNGSRADGWLCLHGCTRRSRGSRTPKNLRKAA